MKYILLLFISLTSTALANTHQHNTHNTDKTHSYVGFHGMALILAGDKVLASHMPLYAPSHDYQIVYEVTTDEITNDDTHLESASPLETIKKILKKQQTSKNRSLFYQLNLI
ncbi:hypothetical protein [Pseudoalteromonas sp. MMG006]|uniref:hypothetical protein n=1 Tax=Pseudoalteromonas sp. MMG006 TaxID=2822683 RepID=UPI001FFC875E|nr:hypothetical protein [Pseudoalteromonas sp. MMG006]